MDSSFAPSQALRALIAKGVHFVNPLTVTVAEDVDPDRISGEDTVIYPGCRIHGAKTVICHGARLGHEAPVVVEDCQIGPKVQLKGGYFRQSVFLEGANLGLGAQVREACILEEEANGAHCVGLKQTILFPFVTLGSLINFCDVLMSGGRSRKDHSEVGSGYIHFNYTPEGDKSTASLLGDVPRGVMLDRPPIFLGGQGGIVGPVQLGFGNVVAAGSVLRHDVPGDNQLVLDAPNRSLVKPYVARQYPALVRIVNNNVLYLANLLALEEWYRHVRRRFFESDEQLFGLWLYEGVLEKLAQAKKERLGRLKTLALKMPESIVASHHASQEPEAIRKKDLYQNIEPLLEIFNPSRSEQTGAAARDRFVRGLIDWRNDRGGNYLEVMKNLPDDLKQQGTAWLQAIVDQVRADAWRILPAYRPAA
ncbi:MAG: UDP-N-acetylglucosamine pyrophosphorylase [Myxococcales bacterium]|nr:UDP-N-acetylglucosamine pyrophosphorylase [Myxococcales bacterium]